MSKTSNQIGSRCSIVRGSRGTFLSLVLENETVRVEIVPELGGKIVSLVRLGSGREFLLQPPDPQRGYRQPSGEASFEDQDSSGFDECVPTIAACRYPEAPFPDLQLPDHGDLWSMPWKFESFAEEVTLEAQGRSLPYRFTRRMRLERNALRLDYEITNLSDRDLRFLWSAHPLLAVEPGAQIVLPVEVADLEVSWSKDDRLGKVGEVCSWPVATDKFGRKDDISTVREPSLGTADKLFTPRLSQGFCALFYPQTNESIAFHFDPGLVPYVGLWRCQGGWPMSRQVKDFTVALEPCNGRPDSLDKAVQRRECGSIAGHETKSWWLRLEVSSGKPQA